MASNVWVRVPKQDMYVRGSEIIEVRVRTLRMTSYGTEYKQGTVSIIRARGADAETEQLTLWTFETRPPADQAAERLMALLSADPPAVVRLDADLEVCAAPLPTI